MAKLALMVEKLDDVEEAYRPLYLEKDGKFTLDADVGDGGAAAGAALKEERAKREAAEKLATKAAKELAALQLKAKADGAGITDEQVRKFREDVRAELETEYAPYKANAEKFGAENRTLKLDNAIKALMGKAGVRGDRHEALWKQTADRYDLTADGTPMVKDKPASDVSKYLSETLKAEFPEWYEGTGSSGGGATGGSRAGTQSTGMTADDILKNPTAARAAMLAAGKTE